MKQFAPHVVDVYKLGHAGMYTEGTNFLYSNLTPRSNKYFKGGRLYDGKMVVSGVQGGIMEIVENWNESFFNQPKAKVLARYKRRVDSVLGAGVVGVDRMAALHDLGYLPLDIRSINEGERIPMKIPMLTIQNTHPDFFWLVNYLETVLSNILWKTSTNATIAYEYKRICTDWAVRTGSPIESVLFQCHDFSMRGMSGPEDAARSSSGPLTSFLGTDTLAAIDYIEDYYGNDLPEDYLIGASIPATEHAVSSSNILIREKRILEDDPECPEVKLEAEAEFLIDYITRQFPAGLCSYVADTYDYWGVLTKILPSAFIKDAIMQRDGKLVIRPDSGDPVEIICGRDYVKIDKGEQYEMEAQVVNILNGDRHTKTEDDWSTELVFDGEQFYTVDIGWHEEYDGEVFCEVSSWANYQLTPEDKGSIQVLWDIFGGTVNEAGFKVLDSHIGLIYGDSITLERADKILTKLADRGFASCNVVFGVGSYTYQCNTRDTFGTAMKATNTAVEGEGFIEIYKDPATGDKLKKSAKGFLHVFKNAEGEFQLVDQVEERVAVFGELKPRFVDGKFFNVENIDTIRKRLV